MTLESQDDRRLLMSMVMTSSDIFAVARPWKAQKVSVIDGGLPLTCGNDLPSVVVGLGCCRVGLDLILAEAARSYVAV